MTRPHIKSRVSEAHCVEITAQLTPFVDTGHAVFLNAVAVAVAEAMGIDKAHDSIATMELGEAQGILCDAVRVFPLSTHV